MKPFLNATSECECGRHKKKTQQWCDHCWAVLGADDRKEFEISVASLVAQIQHLSYRIKGKNNGKT
jgi:hypothetical protein